MGEYIARRKVSNACYEVFEDVVRHPEQLTAEKARQTLLRFEKAINGVPTAGVAPVVPELRKTVELLHNEYEKAKRLNFVYDPLAYAVYQVWKAVDKRRENGR